MKYAGGRTSLHANMRTIRLFHNDLLYPGRLQAMKSAITVLGLLFCLAVPVNGFSYNFLIVMKDGREIAVDTYGYEGTRIILHRDGRLLETDKDSVREIRRLEGKREEGARLTHKYDQPAKEEVINLGRVTFSAFEKGYVSNLGRSSRPKELQWLAEALVPDGKAPGSFPGSQVGFSTRWTKSPTLSVFNGLGWGNRAVENALREVNLALADTSIKIIALDPNDNTAQIKIIFGPAKDFPQETGFDKFQADGRSYVRGVTRDVPGIESVEIWIASDQPRRQEMKFLSQGESLAVSSILRQKHWERVALHELMHALGFSHSSIFEDSIMYFQIVDGSLHGNSRTFLSTRDKKAIKFLYNNVSPGWDRENLRKEAEKNWFIF